MGRAASFMRARESCASFCVGSSFAVAIMSAYVTSPASAPGRGGSEWQFVHCADMRVATSHGRPTAAVPPPAVEGDPASPGEADPVPVDPVLDEGRPAAASGCADAGTCPLSPIEGGVVVEEPPPLGGWPKTMTVVPGGAEHAAKAAAAATSAGPSAVKVFMSMPPVRSEM
jgi:hypothetical protein